ncbi:hypothetical protein F0231_07060 [Vibrio sp. RE86]|uniref:hypothetical protein n=1 Tax=Vibrio sp. RE86 TaxID=2607605 RepID=UPI0014933A00|nr:hypothetical protein [Vibrio sp. RE86]NOH79499.1 hypothetical protein [Vibrio sp. RE86]
MSVPSTILTCDRCGFSSSTSRGSGNYKYLIEGKEVYVSKMLGWCQDCNNFQAIEHFDADRPWNEIIECREEIERLKSRYLPWKNRRYIRYQQDTIEQNTQLLYVFAKRKGSEKCLTCGSQKIIPFDGDCSLKLDAEAYVYTGEKPTGFKHPGCGGEFVATPAEVRLSLRRATVYYDIAGNKL